jgi:endonuclease/exonuclease/phosphatase family metal-dependent hydrolase
MPVTRLFKLAFFYMACLPVMLTSSAEAQIRVVTWNTLHGPTSSIDPNFIRIMASIGTESVNGIAQRADIVALQEVIPSNYTHQNFATMMNNLYGVNSYTAVACSASSGLAQGFVYDSSTLEFLGTQQFYIGTRYGYRIKFRPAGYSRSDAEFYLYSVHLKAGTSDAARRTAEAALLRSNGDALGEGAHLIYCGDFNVYSANEGAYQTMLSPGAGQAFDPKGGSRAWDKINHTQDPSAKMNDRFDFQFLSGEFLDNDGLSLIPGSYRAFGNNGTHQFDGLITTGTGADPDTLYSLTQASDHLPVVADYQIPAMMSVQLGEVSQRVILGAEASIEVRIENIAPTQTSNGADELDYFLQGEAGFQGSTSGSVLALAGAEVQSLLIDAGSAGYKAGRVTVSSDSQAAENADYSSGWIIYEVIDHAKPSFDNAEELQTITLDFGTQVAGSGTQSLNFPLYNLLSDLGSTSDLLVGTPIPLSGATSVLSLAEAPGTIQAGQSLNQTALFAPSAVGTFQSHWQIPVTDESLPGVHSGFLEVVLSGEVIANLNGDYNRDGTVDLADYTLWADSYGKTGDDLPADGNGDGVVDLADYTIWADHFGESLN